MVGHSKHFARISDAVYHAPVTELHSLFLYYHIPQDLARNDPGIVKKYGKSFAKIDFQIYTQSHWLNIDVIVAITDPQIASLEILPMLIPFIDQQHKQKSVLS